MSDAKLRIAFTVPAVPVTQPAKGHRIVKKKDGADFVMAFTSKQDPVNAYKATVAMAARAAYDGPPLTGPLWVSLVFVFPRGGKPGWIKLRDYPYWWDVWKDGRKVPYAICKHDRDNLMKSTQDALNKIIWKDDGLICQGPVEKWIAAEGEQPHVVVVVKAI